MDWDKSILEFAYKYDLILVDANFFDVITDKGNSNICKRLYEIKHLNQLEPYKNELEILHDNLSWKFNGLVRENNVFTVHGVPEELEKFRKSLNETYQWQDKNFKWTRDKNKYDVKSRHKHLTKKNNKFLEEDEPDKPNHHKKSEALIFLDCVVNDLYKIIKNLKIYDATVMDFPIRIHDASDADYRLVSAALDYHRKNKEDKISIISNDDHIWQIRNENSLEKCFDVITLDNYKMFLENLSN